MTHPTSTELFDALGGMGDLAAISAHLDECIACRVWSARLAQAEQLEAPGSQAIEAIARASQTIAVSVQFRTQPPMPHQRRESSGALDRVRPPLSGSARTSATE